MPADNAATSPWLAREDWARGRIRSSYPPGVALAWIITAGFLGVTYVYVARFDLMDDPRRVLTDPATRIVLPFAIALLPLFLWALRRTWRAAAGGRGVLELATIPGAIGGELAGSIRLPRPLGDGESMRLILRCGSMSWRRESGKNVGRTATLWEDDREIAAAEIARRGNVIPVHFTIPATADPTVEHEGTATTWRAVSWYLEVSGEPGGFWRSRYEVPVFRTAQSPAAHLPDVSDVRAMIAARLEGTAFDETRGELLERPPSSRITTAATSDGLEITLPDRKRFLLATVLFVVTLPLYVAPFIAARWLPQYAAEVTISRSLWAALFLNILPALVFIIGMPRRIVINPREIVVHCGWPVLGTRRRFPMDQYDGIDPTPQYFAVLRKNATFFKRRFFLTPGLKSNAEARWLAAEITRAIGK